MYRITFVVDAFRGPFEQEQSHAQLRILLRALTLVDVEYLRRHPETPLLYKSGVVYQEEPIGQEDWQDIPTTLKLKRGDCLPLTTRILDQHERPVTLGSLKEGDKILGHDGKLVTILDLGFTGVKPLLAFTLSNMTTFRCTPNHRVFLKSGNELRARDVKVGDSLPGLLKESHRVEAVREEEAEPVGCVKTETGRVYLPDQDLGAANCEDLAAWRCAELQVRAGENAWPTFIWKIRPNGGYLYHIQVKREDGSIEDPSRALGMK